MEAVLATALCAASVTSQPRGKRRPASDNISSAIKSAICSMCLLDLYHGFLHLASHSSRTNFAGLDSQLINCHINKTQVWPTHNELRCLNEFNSCIKEKRQRKSIREKFFSQRVNISHRLQVSGTYYIAQMIFITGKTTSSFTCRIFKWKKLNPAVPEAVDWLAQNPDSGFMRPRFKYQLLYFLAMNLGKPSDLGLGFSYLQNRDNNRANIFVLLGRLS